MAKAKLGAAAVVDMTGAGPTGAEGAEDAAAIAGDAAVAVAAADAASPPEAAAVAVAPVDEAAEAKARLAAITAELAAIGDPDLQVQRLATLRGNLINDHQEWLKANRQQMAEVDTNLRDASEKQSADRDVIRVRIREAVKLSRAFGLPFEHGQSEKLIGELGLKNLVG